MKCRKYSYIILIFFLFSGTSYTQTHQKNKSNLTKFPRSIQATDYEAIKFIENLYTSLTKLDTVKVNCTVQKDLLSFYSPARPSKVTNLRINKENIVFLNYGRYSNSNVHILYRSLYNILRDFSKNFPIESVKYTQFPTISYKKRTIIEFKIGNQIVLLDSDSNGPVNKDRQYRLNIIKRNDSFFWR